MAYCSLAGRLGSGGKAEAGSDKPEPELISLHLIAPFKRSYGAPGQRIIGICSLIPI